MLFNVKDEETCRANESTDLDALEADVINLPDELKQKFINVYSVILVAGG